MLKTFDNLSQCLLHLIWKLEISLIDSSWLKRDVIVIEKS